MEIGITIKFWPKEANLFPNMMKKKIIKIQNSHFSACDVINYASDWKKHEKSSKIGALVK